MRQSLGKKREKRAWKAGRTREEPVFEIAASLLLEKTHLRQNSLYPKMERNRPEPRRSPYLVHIRRFIRQSYDAIARPSEPRESAAVKSNYVSPT
jgi:hypothetical protein